MPYKLMVGDLPEPDTLTLLDPFPIDYDVPPERRFRSLYESNWSGEPAPRKPSMPQLRNTLARMGIVFIEPEPTTVTPEDVDRAKALFRRCLGWR